MATEDLYRYTPKNWQFLCGEVVEYCKRVFWRLKRLLCAGRKKGQLRKKTEITANF